ncbi:MAG: hypothetical protein ACOC43_16780 [Desulfohalobiaceae bacterium]
MRRKNIWKSTPERGSSTDLSLLEGCSILDLPVSKWEQNMLFSAAKDKWLLQQTGGAFPAALRKDKSTHPIFVLQKLGNMGCRICPCTSRPNRGGRYIVQGCRLEITGRSTDRDSYILEQFSFNLPLNPAFKPKLPLMGKVPQTCIRDKT